MPYFAAIISDRSRYEISMFWADLAPEIRKVGHHVTLVPPPAFRSDLDILDREGERVTFEVDAIGSFENGVLALRVSPTDPLAGLRDGGVAHITLAVAEGFAPKHSNSITHWSPLERPLTLEAVLGVCQ